MQLNTFADLIPYGRHEVTDADIDAVVEVLRSDNLTQGPQVPIFERSVAERVRARHAVAVSSATAALHVACLALELGSGDLLWTVPNTFVASANCARYCGADVDFVDIDLQTGNLSLESLREKLALAAVSGQLPKVLVPVHFAGQPTDQREIWELAQRYGFRVIEDASHAIGASRDSEPVGSCRWSDIVVFSFHPVKIVTTGEGGVAVTNDEELAERMRILRSHGITRDVLRMAPLSSPSPGWRYEQIELGYHYRLTDIAAALGASQLKRLDSYVARRNAIADQYSQAFSSLPLHLPVVPSINRSSFHLYVVRFPHEAKQARRREVYDALQSRNIRVNVHYTPVHLQPYYRRLGFQEGMFPAAEMHGRLALSLPIYPSMSDGLQDVVVKAMRSLVS